jgi:hypothetical protein
MFAAFSPDGERILTTSRDATARVWNADGSGQPYVLSGHPQRLVAAWSADGTRIVARVGEATTVWVWPVREPLRGVDDPRLWAATPDCMSIERRIAFLNVPEARARADQNACELRVQAARAAAASPGPVQVSNVGTQEGRAQQGGSGRARRIGIKDVSRALTSRTPTQLNSP